MRAPDSTSELAYLLKREPLEPVAPVSLARWRSLRPAALSARFAALATVLERSTCGEREPSATFAAADVN